MEFNSKTSGKFFQVFSIVSEIKWVKTDLASFSLVCRTGFIFFAFCRRAQRRAEGEHEARVTRDGLTRAYNTYNTNIMV